MKLTRRVRRDRGRLRLLVDQVGDLARGDGADRPHEPSGQVLLDLPLHLGFRPQLGAATAQRVLEVGIAHGLQAVGAAGGRLRLLLGVARSNALLGVLNDAARGLAGGGELGVPGGPQTAADLARPAPHARDDQIAAGGLPDPEHEAGHEIIVHDDGPPVRRGRAVYVAPVSTRQPDPHRRLRYHSVVTASAGSYRDRLEQGVRSKWRWMQGKGRKRGTAWSARN